MSTLLRSGERSLIIRRGNRHQNLATSLSKAFAMISARLGVMEVARVQDIALDVEITRYNETLLRSGR